MVYTHFNHAKEWFELQPAKVLIFYKLNRKKGFFYSVYEAARKIINYSKRGADIQANLCVTFLLKLLYGMLKSPGGMHPAGDYKYYLKNPKTSSRTTPCDEARNCWKSSYRGVRQLQSV